MWFVCLFLACGYPTLLKTLSITPFKDFGNFVERNQLIIKLRVYFWTLFRSIDLHVFAWANVVLYCGFLAGFGVG